MMARPLTPCSFAGAVEPHGPSCLRSQIRSCTPPLSQIRSTTQRWISHADSALPEYWRHEGGRTWCPNPGAEEANDGALTIVRTDVTEQHLPAIFVGCLTESHWRRNMSLWVLDIQTCFQISYIFLYVMVHVLEMINVFLGARRFLGGDPSPSA
ncbi:uncharacterized protein [Miscanthus floridulus]|uniref:uncharacterized protein n=1 Tax=Miscanthus floridulus TaxID=154761 RepID=UPI00345ADB9C